MRFPQAGLAFALTVLGMSGASASHAADPKRGALLFQTCAACHSPLPGSAGPRLNGVMGRKAGALPNYSYSPAMKASGLIWDETTLRRFLADPKKLVPNTKMIFPGYSDAADIDDLLAYLKSQN